MSTPRTDAVWDAFSKGGHINHDAVFKHAQELELEVASLKDQVALLTDTYETRIGTLEAGSNQLRDALLAIHCDAEHFRDEWIEAQSDGPRELILNIKKHATFGNMNTP